MKIKTALDWPQVAAVINTDLSSIGYNPDLKKMFRNIEGMVTELSKLEVDARRTHSTKYLTPVIDKINQAVDHLEKLILMARLMR